MGDSVISKKTLLASYVDDGQAPRAFSARYNLKNQDRSGDNCSDWKRHNFDQYGRQAHPWSLKQYDEGCNIHNPYNSTNSRIRIENSLRPYIEFSMEQQLPYDTMGAGRSLIDNGAGFMRASRRTSMYDGPAPTLPRPTPQHPHTDMSHMTTRAYRRY